MNKDKRGFKRIALSALIGGSKVLLSHFFSSHDLGCKPPFRVAWTRWKARPQAGLPAAYRLHSSGKSSLRIWIRTEGKNGLRRKRTREDLGVCGPLSWPEISSTW